MFSLRCNIQGLFLGPFTESYQGFVNKRTGEVVEGGVRHGFFVGVGATVVPVKTEVPVPPSECPPLGAAVVVPVEVRGGQSGLKCSAAGPFAPAIDGAARATVAASNGKG